MTLWQIVLAVTLIALWAWAVVAVLIDMFDRADLSGWIRIAWIAAIVTPPVVVFGTNFSNAPHLQSGSVCVEAVKDAVVHGIGLWFRSSLTASISITNAPPNAVPSWEHGFLPLDEPFEVLAGDHVHFQVSSSGTGAEWTWEIGSRRRHYSATVGSTCTG
jgi:hypothetical protein